MAQIAGDVEKRMTSKTHCSTSEGCELNFKEVLERAEGLVQACRKYQSTLEKRTDEDVSTLNERLDRLEQRGVDSQSDDKYMHDLVSAVAEKLREEMKESNKKLLEQMEALNNQRVAEITELKEKLVKVEADYARCKAAISVNLAREFMPNRPQNYKGTRNPNEIDDFLQGVERYFDAVSVLDEKTKVTLATLCLEDDAMLWWRGCQEEMGRGTRVINTWEDFKMELKRQFDPMNDELGVMKRLRSLRHTETVKDYIKAYNSLMLEVPDMSEKERLLYFMDGLQPWAKRELRRRNVQDLPTAIREAESLIEFKMEKKGKGRKDGSIKAGGVNPQEINHKPEDRKDKGCMEDKGKKYSKRGCFMCGGNHYFRDCPEKKEFNAIITPRRDKEEQEEARIGFMTLVNSSGIESERLYTDIKVKGVPSKAVVSTGSSHNFVSPKEVDRIGLTVTKEARRVKAVNSCVRPSIGVAYGVPITRGSWERRVNFIVMEMDGIDMVLGMEFINVAPPLSFTKDGIVFITNDERGYMA